MNIGIVHSIGLVPVKAARSEAAAQNLVIGVASVAPFVIVGVEDPAGSRDVRDERALTASAARGLAALLLVAADDLERRKQ